MIPPRSFVKSVYCASPAPIFSRSFESSPCRSSFALGPSTSISPCARRRTRRNPFAPPGAPRSRPRTGRASPTPRTERAGRRGRRAGRERRAEQRLACGLDPSEDPSATRPEGGVAPAEPERRTGSFGRRRAPACLRAPSVYRASEIRNFELSRRAGTTAHRARRRRPRSPRARGSGATRPSSRRRRLRCGPKPVAITVTRTWSPSLSSITAPKITLAFWSAAPVTTSAASLTSKSPMSGPPETLSRIPVAPSIEASSSGDETAVAQPRPRGSRRRPRRCPSARSRRRA